MQSSSEFQDNLHIDSIDDPVRTGYNDPALRTVAFRLCIHEHKNQERHIEIVQIESLVNYGSTLMLSEITHVKGLTDTIAVCVFPFIEPVRTNKPLRVLIEAIRTEIIPKLSITNLLATNLAIVNLTRLARGDGQHPSQVLVNKSHHELKCMTNINFGNSATNHPLQAGPTKV
jgi:hypothetical protein